MASTLSPSAVGGTPTARIGLDLSALIAGPSIARTAGQSIAREISNAFKPLQNEQRLALEQARQTTVSLRTQQSQISSSARAESAVRVAAAKAEQAERTQAARATASAVIEAERRATAEFRSQLRQRDAAARTSAALRRGTATFAGAALGGPVGGIAGALAGGSAAIPLVAGLAVGQSAQLMGEGIRAASDLTESINKVGVAFDESGQSVLRWSQNSATALGQSRHDALEAASSFGLLFREMGLGSQRSVEMSQRMVELATDMASIHNIRPEDALEKLRAGLVGETRPLRDVGVLLNDQIVRQKAVAMGLAETTAAVTEQERVLARYQLILEQTSRTQGDFQRTIGGLANQQRIANAQWEDFLANLGKLSEGPAGVGLVGVNAALAKVNQGMDWFNEKTQLAVEQWQLLGQIVGGLPLSVALAARQMESFDRAMIGAGRTRPALPSAGREFTDEQTQLIVDRDRQLRTIDRRMNEQIIDSASQYAKRRADTIATYEKQIARDAEDYGRQRVRAQAKFEQSIAKVQSDGAERRAELQSKYDEDVADARNKSNKKLADLQADYDKDRERAERSHRDTLLDAAARLDAVAVMAEQRRFAEEKRTREEDHAEAIQEEKDSLDEQLEERRKNYADQLAEARRNDAERIADLTAAFEEQRRQEEEDRTLRLERQAADHAAQLTEMDNQQVERIAQIKTNAADERAQYEEEFQRAAVAAGIRIQAWIDQNNKVTDEAIKSFDRLMDEIIKRTVLREQALANQGGLATPGGPILSRATGGPVNRTGPVLAHAGEYVLSPAATTAIRNTIGSFDQAGLVAALQGGGGGRSVTWNGDVSVNIAGSTNMGASEMYSVARRAFEDALGEIAAT